jgi:hypothetical protein
VFILGTFEHEYWYCNTADKYMQSQ